MSKVEIEDNTSKVLSEMQSAVHRALESIGQVAVKNVSARTPVQTGRLKASNDYELQGKNKVVIANVQDYAPYVLC